MFTHLHVHTEYSMLDGISRIPDLVAQTKSLGMDSIAIIDLGHPDDRGSKCFSFMGQSNPLPVSGPVII